MLEFLTLCAVVAGAYDQAPVMGQAAPAFTFQAVLGGKADEWDLAKLKGKVVVVDFSASWCGPCRLAFPHFNKLATGLKGKGIEFISVTAEDEATAAKFRKEMKMTMPLAVDRDGSTFERYWISGIPEAVVIDKEGKLTARLHPTQLTEKDLIALATQGKANFPNDGSVPARRAWNPNKSATKTTGTWFKKDQINSGRAMVDPKTGVISFDGIHPIAAISIAYEHGGEEIECPPDVAKAGFASARVEAPDKTLKTARRILRRLIDEQYGVTVENVTRVQKCYRLRRKPDAKLAPALAKDETGNAIMLGSMNLRYATGDILGQWSRNFLDLPVVNETGIDKPFAINIKWDATKGKEGLVKALDAAGFILEEGEAPVRWLVLKKVS